MPHTKTNKITIQNIMKRTWGRSTWSYILSNKSSYKQIFRPLPKQTILNLSTASQLYSWTGTAKQDSHGTLQRIIFAV